MRVTNVNNTLYNTAMAEEEPPRTIETLPPELAEIIKPEETAIIVVDVMDAYFDRGAVLPQFVGAGTTQLEAAAKRIREFLDTSRQYPIAATVFARMIERPEVMPANFRYKMTVTDDVPPLVEVDGPGWDYHGVQPQPGDHEISKTHYNAFTDTDLHQHLQERGVKTVVLIGGYGSRCVAATAIIAADVYGYHVFVPNDLIANLDSSNAAGGTNTRIDEIPGFLQALNAVWGYSPSSAAILGTWEQSSRERESPAETNSTP